MNSNDDSNLSFKQWQQTGRYFNYRGHCIFYQDSLIGDNVILLIHGFPTASWDWHKIWKPLSKHYRLITLDMIGFGYSDKPVDYPYSIFDQADLYQAFTSHLSINSVHVVAHDYGDTVTQELIARFNQQAKSDNTMLNLQSVCLLNGGLFPEVHKARLIQKLLNSPVGFMVSKLLTQEKFERSMSAVFSPSHQPSPLELSELWQLASHQQGHRLSHRLIRYIDERKINRGRWVEALQTTSIPLRFINGNDDPISGIDMANRYQELIPAPDIIHLAKIGHYPQLEAPDAVINAILELLP